MKKIHDMLKARKKHLHSTHDKKQHTHTDFHSPIFERPLFCKRDVKLSELAAALNSRGESGLASSPPRNEAQGKLQRGVPGNSAGPTDSRLRGNDRGNRDEQKSRSEDKRASGTRFFSQKHLHGLLASQATMKKASEGSANAGSESDALEKERIAKLRELLKDIIEHPGTMTPHMFWVLFMKIAPHFSMMTAGCVRLSALFWLMLSYIKAKNKTKKRKLKEQLVAAAELLEEEESSMSAKVRR